MPGWKLQVRARWRRSLRECLRLPLPPKYDSGGHRVSLSRWHSLRRGRHSLVIGIYLYYVSSCHTKSAVTAIVVVIVFTIRHDSSSSSFDNIFDTPYILNESDHRFITKKIVIERLLLATVLKWSLLYVLSESWNYYITGINVRHTTIRRDSLAMR